MATGPRRGRDSKLSLLGTKGGSPGGSSLSTGPNEGKGAGRRDSGTPEGVTYKTERIHPESLDPTGRIVGTLPFEGDAPEGEASLEIQKVMRAAQLKAEKVEQEAIPVEYKEQVRRYMESLLPGSGQPASGGEGSSSGTDPKGGDGEKR